MALIDCSFEGLGLSRARYQMPERGHRVLAEGLNIPCHPRGIEMFLGRASLRELET